MRYDIENSSIDLVEASNLFVETAIALTKKKRCEAEGKIVANRDRPTLATVIAPVAKEKSLSLGLTTLDNAAHMSVSS
jgi:hypothetical protein